MKRLQVSIFVSLLACTTGNAWAQYGLYGAPDMLNLQPAPAATDHNGYVAPSAYQVEGPAGNAYTPMPATDYAQPLQMAAEGAPAPASVLPPAPPMPGGQLKTMPTPPVPAINPAPGPVSPALTEPNYTPCYTPGFTVSSGSAGSAGCGVYGSAVQQYEQAAAGGQACDACAGHWYGSVLALAMTRDSANKLWTTYQNGNQSNQIMNTQDAGVGWEWGGEIRFGRTFCCDQYAIEATYWTLHEFQGSSCASEPVSPTDPYGLVSSPLTTGLVTFNGWGANGWFDNCLRHTLQRTDEVHDVELNFVRNRLCGGECGCPLSIDVSAGMRYFRFRDDLVWGGEAQDETWAYFSDNIANNLVGGQIGFNVEYQACKQVKFFVTPKFGIYDNIIQSNFGADMIDASGHCVIGQQTSYPGETYPVHSTCNSFSFLAQVDVGMDWQITQSLSAKLGYRVLAATGIGLADNQIPPYLNDIPTIQDIDRNGSLILHGAFAGLTYCF